MIGKSRTGPVSTKRGIVGNGVTIPRTARVAPVPLFGPAWASVCRTKSRKSRPYALTEWLDSSVSQIHGTSALAVSDPSPCSLKGAGEEGLDLIRRRRTSPSKKSLRSGTRGGRGNWQAMRSDQRAEAGRRERREAAMPAIPSPARQRIMLEGSGTEGAQDQVVHREVFRRVDAEFTHVGRGVVEGKALRPGE